MKKGFTLIELLAVIAILAILIIIAIPTVLKIFKEAKQKTFLVQVQTIYGEAKKQYQIDQIKNTPKTIYSSLGEDKLNISVSSIEYYVEIAENKVTKFQASNSEFAIDLNGTNIQINEIEIAAITESTPREPEPTPASCFDFDLDRQLIYTYYYQLAECPSNVVIPSTIEGIPVTALNRDSFKGMGLTSVVIPNSVNIILESALADNLLTSITIQSTNIIIQDYIL